MRRKLLLFLCRRIRRRLAFIPSFIVSTYSVYCYRFEDSPELIESGLGLEDAQSICRDPETSSRTASDPSKHGSNPWFYGFTEE